jgi:hypothetical protein
LALYAGKIAIGLTTNLIFPVPLQFGAKTSVNVLRRKYSAILPLLLFVPVHHGCIKAAHAASRQGHGRDFGRRAARAPAVSIMAPILQEQVEQLYFESPPRHHLGRLALHSRTPRFLLFYTTRHLMGVPHANGRGCTVAF